MTILGSGTSHGVPVIGCDCHVCRSGDYRNKRTRSSVWLHDSEISIVIDTATDFRAQALREGITRLDAVLVTHSHADHIHGLDDTRSLTCDASVPLYANKETAADIRNRFDYVFRGPTIGGGKPKIRIVEIEKESFEVGNLQITPIPIRHGNADILGFRFGTCAYLTDCSAIGTAAFERLSGVEILIIGALRYKPHPTHFSVDEAVEASRRIGAERTYLTHMCHNIEHSELTSRLPGDIEPTYDGLKIEIAV